MQRSKDTLSSDYECVFAWRLRHVIWNSTLTYLSSSFQQALCLLQQFPIVVRRCLLQLTCFSQSGICLSTECFNLTCFAHTTACLAHIIRTCPVLMLYYRRGRC